MQNFDDIKESLGDYLDQLNKYSKNISNQLITIYSGNCILKDKLLENEIINVKNIGESLNTNLEMIRRSKMKCAFFGKTSNGKSAVINAMLGEEVLPSCCGRTTSCFITVEGSYEEDGYFVDKDNSIMPISQLEDFASEYDETAYGIDSQIQVFWPIFRCNLLQHEVQLIDSPGCDVSVDKDSWIDKYCLDADVFVYVVDASSTICKSERDFFKKVKNQVGNPNLFVLLNKWDLCRNNSSQTAIRLQHTRTIEEFFRDDMVTRFDLEKRVFFISAKESLNEYSPDFQRFLDSLTMEMTQRAVVTKCKVHSDKGIESINAIILFVDKILQLQKSTNCSYIAAKVDNDELIGKIFLEIEHKCVKYLVSKCNNYVSTITENIRQQRQTVDGVSTFIECHFMHIFNDLQTTIEGTLPEITERLRSAANVTIDATLMSNYMPSTFRDLMSRYRTKFQDKKINSDITNAYNELDSYLRPTFSGGLYRHTNIAVIDYGIFAIKSIFGGILDTISSIASTIKKEITGSDPQANLEKMLRDKISDFLTKTARSVINECREDVAQRISDIGNIFVGDCESISQLMESLESTKMLLEILVGDFEMIHARIESMNNE